MVFLEKTMIYLVVFQWSLTYRVNVGVPFPCILMRLLLSQISSPHGEGLLAEILHQGYMYPLKPSRPLETLPPFCVIWIYSHQQYDKLSTFWRPFHAENHQSHKSHNTQNIAGRDECRLWHGCVTVVLCCCCCC